MTSNIAQNLISLNHDFYRRTAQSFSESRHYFWAGWSQVLPLINSQLTTFYSHQLSTNFRVLDLGCGNGRFARFLAENINLQFAFQYLGWDSSTDLLKLAQEKITTQVLQNQSLKLHPQTKFDFDLIDLATSDFSIKLQNEQPFSIICLFGVLHHLPNFQSRQKLLEQLASQLVPQGLLIFSLWQFMKDSRLKARVLAPQLFPPEINPQDLEKNDYLLDWRDTNYNQSLSTNTTPPLRYCHNFDNQEINQIISNLTSNSSPLQLLTRFEADGKQDNPLNTYLVFQKQS